MTQETQTSLRPFVEHLVRLLVDAPDEVSIGEVPGGDTVTYEVRVAATDLGKVIGKQGRIANALRTVAKAASLGGRHKVYVEIVA